MQLRFCYYDLFLQKQTANSYIVEVWLEQRRRDSNPLNSESLKPNILAVSPSGHLTSSFASFGRSGRYVGPAYRHVANFVTDQPTTNKSILGVGFDHDFYFCQDLGLLFVFVSFYLYFCICIIWLWFVLLSGLGVFFYVCIFLFVFLYLYHLIMICFLVRTWRRTRFCPATASPLSFHLQVLI